MTRKTNQKLDEAARRLLRDPFLVYRAGQAISDLGVVGEERNRLIVFLAGVSRELAEPGSVLVKGPSSSGKSNLVAAALQLFPPEDIIERASLSAKAPALREDSLSRKILFIQEYRGGKDAQMLVRLLQSEGKIAHEYGTVVGRQHGTVVAEQIGRPVVLTTTTNPRVFPDDETRFLSLHIDESAFQTLQILRAQVRRRRRRITPSLRVWRRAMSLVKRNDGDFQSPPDWLTYVAEQLPAGNVRTRRDWKRCLSFCGAVALLRHPADGTPVNIDFSDYAVVYKILESALSATAQAVHRRELAVMRAAEAIGKQESPVRVRDIAEHLGWKESLVYKYVRLALTNGHLALEPDTHERNQKFIVPNPDRRVGFLPRPASVFRHNKELGASARYVDPLTGEWRVFRRD